MTRLVLLFAALAVALAQNDPETTAAPPPEEPVKNKEIGSGESPTAPQPQCVSLGGGMVTFELFLGPDYNIEAFTPAVAAQFQALVATTLSASSSLCVTLGSVGFDKRNTPYFSVSVTGLASGATSVTALYSGTVFDSFFNTTVNMASISSYDLAPTNPNGDPRDKEGTPGTNFDSNGGTAPNPCQFGATGSLSAVLHFPGFNLANYNEAHTGIILGAISFRIGANPLCMSVLGTAVDVNGVPYAHISATALWDAAAAAAVLANSEFTDISNVFGVPVSISDIRITTASVAPKEDPVTSAPVVTTQFNYDALIPMAIDNIDRATGQFNPAFLQRVVEGCARDSHFCTMIMNILTSYISLLTAPTGAPPVDKEGTGVQSSTSSGSSGSGLSLGAVLAISGSALVAVVVVAMVALKIKTGRFVPSRPSSRVSVSSDTRALTSHSSRISVRAWPNAMEV